MAEGIDFNIGEEIAFHYADRPDTVVVITRVDPYSGFVDGMDGKGLLYANKNPKNWTKTGRYFPEVKLLLEALNKND